MIFTEVDLRPKEDEHLDNFREHCKKQNIDIPEGYDDESRFVLRVLQGKKWNYEVTINQIIAHNVWKKATYPLQYDPIKDILNTGVIYGFKRDRNMRPVIVVDCQKIIELSDKIDLLVSATNYFLDHVIQNAMIPGKIENWTAIFDMNDLGAFKLMSKHIQLVVKAMQKNYPGRLFRFFGVGISLLFKGFWDLA